MGLRGHLGHSPAVRGGSGGPGSPRPLDPGPHLEAGPGAVSPHVQAQNSKCKLKGVSGGIRLFFLFIYFFNRLHLFLSYKTIWRLQL